MARITPCILFSPLPTFAAFPRRWPGIYHSGDGRSALNHPPPQVNRIATTKYNPKSAMAIPPACTTRL